MLFVGREFFRKGGELVVSAIEQLRRSGSGDFTLTVVGPATWPFSTPVPDWVDFRGEVPASEARQMWADHDIFALPTWYEPYGKVFIEARAAGMPALGRAAFCLPNWYRHRPVDSSRPTAEWRRSLRSLLAISRDDDLFVSAAADSDSVRANCRLGQCRRRVG